MADKLVLNADLNYKTAEFTPEKCTVEKVIEVSETEFRKFYEKPMKPNYYLSPYKKLMGFYDESYHCVLIVNEKNGDGLLINSEGADTLVIRSIFRMRGRLFRRMSRVWRLMI